MICPDRRLRGYSLIEVLVAFVILGLALTVLLRIFSSGLRNLSVSSDYSRAVLIAESRIAAASYDHTLLLGDSSGTEGERFRWTQHVSPYTPWLGYETTAEGLQAVYITVRVEWTSGAAVRHIDLGTIKLVRPGDLES